MSNFQISFQNLPKKKTRLSTPHKCWKIAFQTKNSGQTGNIHQEWAFYGLLRKVGTRKGWPTQLHAEERERPQAWSHSIIYLCATSRNLKPAKCCLADIYLATCEQEAEMTDLKKKTVRKDLLGRHGRLEEMVAFEVWWCQDSMGRDGREVVLDSCDHIDHPQQTETLSVGADSLGQATRKMAFRIQLIRI